MEAAIRERQSIRCEFEQLRHLEGSDDFFRIAHDLKDGGHEDHKVGVGNIEVG
jgi:hypothetical protein